MDLNNVDFPEEHVQTASEWHGGQSCILYAVASTGGLTRGTIRPVLCDDDGNYTPASDEQWLRHLWDELETTLSRLIRLDFTRAFGNGSRKGKPRGTLKLRRFRRWVTRVLADADNTESRP